MTVWIAILLSCTSPDMNKVKCELIGDTEIYRSHVECITKAKSVNENFTCTEVKVKQ